MRAYEPVTWLAVAASWLAASLAVAPAAGQSRVGYGGIRWDARLFDGTSFAIQADRLMEDKIRGSGHVLVPRSALAPVLGSEQALAACRDDTCMAMAASGAGAQAVIWGWLERPAPYSYRLQLRVLSLPAGELVDLAQPQCTSCGPEGLLPSLAELDLRKLRLGSMSQPQAVSQEPARGTTTRVLRHVPGVHRPLTDAERARAGRVDVITVPPAARVELFGYDIGETPVHGQELLAGAYRIRIHKEGFQDVDTSLFVQPGRTTPVSVTLTPVAAMLRVVTVPVAATVAVDGRVVGETPIAARVLPIGVHEVTVSKEGYSPVTKQVEADPGQPVELTLTLTEAPPDTGLLTVKTRPGRASVSLDGEPVGQSPVRRLEVSAGEHVLDLYLSGYEPVSQQVVVPGGGHRKVAVKLSKARDANAYLTVTSTPPGAKATLGKIPIGTTPVRKVAFKPGRQVLRLVKPGLPPYEFPITLTRGEHLKYHADLRKGPPDISDEVFGQGH